MPSKSPSKDEDVEKVVNEFPMNKFSLLQNELPQSWSSEATLDDATRTAGLLTRVLHDKWISDMTKLLRQIQKDENNRIPLARPFVPNSYIENFAVVRPVGITTQPHRRMAIIRHLFQAGESQNPKCDGCTDLSAKPLFTECIVVHNEKKGRSCTNCLYSGKKCLVAAQPKNDHSVRAWNSFQRMFSKYSAEDFAKLDPAFVEKLRNTLQALSTKRKRSILDVDEPFSSP